MKPTLPEPDIILAVDQNTGMWAESYAKIGAECFHADTVRRLIDEAYEAGQTDCDHCNGHGVLCNHAQDGSMDCVPCPACNSKEGV